MLIDSISDKINHQAGVIIQAILSDSKLTQRASIFKFTGTINYSMISPLIIHILELISLTEIMHKISHISALKESIALKYLEILEKDG